MGLTDALHADAGESEASQRPSLTSLDTSVKAVVNLYLITSDTAHDLNKKPSRNLRGFVPARLRLNSHVLNRRRLWYDMVLSL